MKGDMITIVALDVLSELPEDMGVAASQSIYQSEFFVETYLYVLMRSTRYIGT